MRNSRRDVQPAWASLAAQDPPLGYFDPADVAHLPPAARRLLTRALAPGVALTPTVVLAMEGAIRLRDWTTFQARQVLRVGAGMAMDATLHRGPLRFAGADVLWQGVGSRDIRLWGVVPVMSASGPDITRSRGDLLAVETVAWAPQGLTPAMGATWQHLDDTHAVVTLPVAGRRVPVSVEVDRHGALRKLSMHRWGDPGNDGFGLHPFGGAIDDHERHDGVTIASAGSGGWHWGMPRHDDGEYVRWTVTSASFPGTTFPETIHGPASAPPGVADATFHVPNRRRQASRDG